MMIGGVAASAAVRTWPFRVFSFPSEIVVAESLRFAEFRGLHMEAMLPMIKDLMERDSILFDKIGEYDPVFAASYRRDQILRQIAISRTARQASRF